MLDIVTELLADRGQVLIAHRSESAARHCPGHALAMA
jgi:hypothetical protein